MLVHPFAKFKKIESLPLLINFLKDDDMYRQSIIALGNLKAEGVKEYIEKFSNHEDPWVRKKVKAALLKCKG